MHALAFKSKRIHLGLLALQRTLLTDLEITPARVELLVIMARCGVGPEKAMRQSEIWRALGVRRTVTARMLAAMEEDGLVTRSRHPSDLRQRTVRITRAARVLLFHVERLAFRFKLGLLVMFSRAKELLAKLDSGFDWLRKFVDRSRFEYPSLPRLSRVLPRIPRPVPECWRPILHRIREGAVRESARRQKSQLHAPIGRSGSEDTASPSMSR